MPAGDLLRLVTRAAMVVHDLRVVGGFAEQGVAEQLGRVREATAAVPQLA